MQYPFLNFNILKTAITFCVVLITMLVDVTAMAQVLDDSTKQVYSAKTTKYVLEDDFLNGKYNIETTDTTYLVFVAKHRIDTVLQGIHRYNYLFRNKQFYQDLGNYLSPIQPIYFQQRTTLGKELGLNAFDLYTPNASKVKYYDTKSPYSKVEYIQGSLGVQDMKVEVSRNIASNWNIGFELKRQVSKKILGTNNGTGGALKALEASDYFFTAYSRYYSINQRYQILANLTHGHQIYYNNGGIKATVKDSIVSENFSYQQAAVYLQNARTIDKRINYHVYQEYMLTSKRNIQLYTISDYSKRTFRFNNSLTRDNKSFNADTAFYFQPVFDANSNTLESKFFYSKLGTFDRTDYHLLENQIGVKAQLGNLNVRGYFRRKDFNYQQLSYTKDSIAFSKDFLFVEAAEKSPISNVYNENFVGTTLNYQLSNAANINFDGESYIGQDYRLKAHFQNKFAQLGYSKISHSPTLVQRMYRSNVKDQSWVNISPGNAFVNTVSDKLWANLKYQSTHFTINPGVSYETNKNLIYYDTLALPAQANSNLNFFSADLNLIIDIKHIHFDTYLKYTTQNVDSFFVVPKLFVANKLYFQNGIFKKAALIQLGFDTYWRTSYFGSSYMPVTQQFYNNNTFELKSFLQIDMFLNVQIKNACLFFKVPYINKGRNNGYFITPNYTAVPNSIDFGIRWLFYD